VSTVPARETTRGYPTAAARRNGILPTRDSAHAAILVL